MKFHPYMMIREQFDLVIDLRCCFRVVKMEFLACFFIFVIIASVNCEDYVDSLKVNDYNAYDEVVLKGDPEPIDYDSFLTDEFKKINDEVIPPQYGDYVPKPRFNIYDYYSFENGMYPMNEDSLSMDNDMYPTNDKYQLIAESQDSDSDINIEPYAFPDIENQQSSDDSQPEAPSIESLMKNSLMPPPFNSHSEDQFMYLNPAVPNHPFLNDYDPDTIQLQIETGNNLQLQLEIFDTLKKLMETNKNPKIQLTIFEESVYVVTKDRNTEFDNERLSVEELDDIDIQVSEGQRDIFLVFGWTLMITGVLLSCLVVYAGRKMAKERQRKIFVCRGQMPYEPLKTEV